MRNAIDTAPVELPVAGQPAERRDAAVNRARILCAARTLLSEHGAAGLSMNAVARAAGVGKGTIFRRFGDRDGLVQALLDEDSTALQDALLTGPPPLGPGAPPAQRLEAFLRALATFHHRHIEALLACDRLTHDPPPVFGVFLLHTRLLIEEIDPGLDAPVLAAALVGAGDPQNLRWLLGDAPLDSERVGDVLSVLVRGLTAAGASRRHNSQPPSRPGA